MIQTKLKGMGVALITPFKAVSYTHLIDVEPKATAMLADFVGADLSRLTGELEKLIITLPKGHTRVTPEQIEKNIGISKDYNNFELRSADVYKRQEYGTHEPRLLHSPGTV